MESKYYVLALVVFFVVCVIIIRQIKKPRTEIVLPQKTPKFRSYARREPPTRDLQTLQKDTNLIVVDASDAERPIVQTVEQFRQEMNGHEGQCFILTGIQGLRLQPYQPFRVTQSGHRLALIKTTMPEIFNNNTA